MVPHHAISLIADNQKGILRDIGSVCAEQNANITSIQQEILTRGPDKGYAWADIEIEGGDDTDAILSELRLVTGVRVVLHDTFEKFLESASSSSAEGPSGPSMGAVNEADRHNIEANAFLSIPSRWSVNRIWRVPWKRSAACPAPRSLSLPVR